MDRTADGRGRPTVMGGLERREGAVAHGARVVLLLLLLVVSGWGNAANKPGGRRGIEHLVGILVQAQAAIARG